MEESLLPCPFCGSEEVSLHYETDIGTRYWGVNCKRCPGNVEAEFLDKRDAVKAWHRRVY